MNDSDDNELDSVEQKHPATLSSASREELELLRKVRLALGSMLHMLDCTRDDLTAMGDRMDRLRAASEHCRMALEEKKRKEQELEQQKPSAAADTD